MAFTALLGADKLVGQVQYRLHAKTIGHSGHDLVFLGIILTAAKLDELLLPVADLVLADQPSCLLVLEHGMMFQQEIVELLLLLHIPLERPYTLRFRLAVPFVVLILLGQQ